MGNGELPAVGDGLVTEFGEAVVKAAELVATASFSRVHIGIELYADGAPGRPRVTANLTRGAGHWSEDDKGRAEETADLVDAVQAEVLDAVETTVDLLIERLSGSDVLKRDSTPKRAAPAQSGAGYTPPAAQQAAPEVGDVPPAAEGDPNWRYPLPSGQRKVGMVTPGVTWTAEPINRYRFIGGELELFSPSPALKWALVKAKADRDELPPPAVMDALGIVPGTDKAEIAMPPDIWAVVSVGSGYSPKSEVHYLDFVRLVRGFHNVSLSMADPDGIVHMGDDAIDTGEPL